MPARLIDGQLIASPDGFRGPERTHKAESLPLRASPHFCVPASSPYRPHIGTASLSIDQCKRGCQGMTSQRTPLQPLEQSINMTQSVSSARPHAIGVAGLKLLLVHDAASLHKIQRHFRGGACSHRMGTQHALAKSGSGRHQRQRAGRHRPRQGHAHRYFCIFRAGLQEIMRLVRLNFRLDIGAPAIPNPGRR